MNTKGTGLSTKSPVKLTKEQAHTLLLANGYNVINSHISKGTHGAYKEFQYYEHRIKYSSIVVITQYIANKESSQGVKILTEAKTYRQLQNRI